MLVKDLISKNFTPSPYPPRYTQDAHVDTYPAIDAIMENVLHTTTKPLLIDKDEGNFLANDSIS